MNYLNEAFLNEMISRFKSERCQNRNVVIISPPKTLSVALYEPEALLVLSLPYCPSKLLM